MATNEIENGCGLSIEAVLTSNQKRRCVLMCLVSLLEPELAMSEETPKYTIADDLDPDGDMSPGADPMAEIPDVPS
jgi:hypothetical protein